MAQKLQVLQVKNLKEEWEDIERLCKALENIGVKIKSAVSRRVNHSGPDIIAEKGEEQWIIEFQRGSDLFVVDTGVGQLIRRMATADFKRSKFYLALFKPLDEKVPTMARRKGVGVIGIDEHWNLNFIEPLLTFKQTEKGSKTEMVRFRCSLNTKREFKKVATDFKNSEEAILAFIKAYNQYPSLFASKKALAQFR